MHLLDHVAHNNLLRSRHPAEKALFSAGLLGVCLVLPPWPTSALVTASTCLAAVLVAGIRPGVLLCAMRIPLLFMALSGLSLALSIVHTSGHGLSVTVTRDSLLGAAMVLSRAFAAYSCLLFLALTTPLPALLGLMRRCRMPEPVVDVALSIYNMLFVISDSWQRMATAQHARLGHNGIRQAYRSTALLVAGLLGRALRRSRNLENGLASRGFQGRMRVLDNNAPLSIPALLLAAATVSVVAVLGAFLGA